MQMACRTRLLSKSTDVPAMHTHVHVRPRICWAPAEQVGGAGRAGPAGLQHARSSPPSWDHGRLNVQRRHPPPAVVAVQPLATSSRSSDRRASTDERATLPSWDPLARSLMIAGVGSASFAAPRPQASVSGALALPGLHQALRPRLAGRRLGALPSLRLRADPLEEQLVTCQGSHAMLTASWCAQTPSLCTQAPGLGSPSAGEAVSLRQGFSAAPRTPRAEQAAAQQSPQSLSGAGPRPRAPLIGVQPGTPRTKLRRAKHTQQAGMCSQARPTLVGSRL